MTAVFRPRLFLFPLLLGVLALKVRGIGWCFGGESFCHFFLFLAEKSLIGLTFFFFFRILLILARADRYLQISRAFVWVCLVIMESTLSPTKKCDEETTKEKEHKQLSCAEGGLKTGKENAAIVYRPTDHVDVFSLREFMDRRFQHGFEGLEETVRPCVIKVTSRERDTSERISFCVQRHDLAFQTLLFILFHVLL